ncbi:MAG: RBBP9/YdeN family alpha/beta hydrolase [Novosphingobium sp.]
MSTIIPGQSNHAPLILTVPGLDNSGPDHWQTRWERQRGDCRRVDLGMWSKPHRNTWVNKLNLAIRQADRPVVLVAHSLGCLAVAWWAQLEQPGPDSPVRGALLVAPPEVDFFPRDERIASFAPTPAIRLPFPSILIASHDDPYMGFRTSRRLARVWGSNFADAGKVGHINADSDIGDWPFGQFMLGILLRRTGPEVKGQRAEAPATTEVHQAFEHSLDADRLTL